MTRTDSLNLRELKQILKRKLPINKSSIITSYYKFDLEAVEDKLLDYEKMASFLKIELY